MHHASTSIKRPTTNQSLYKQLTKFSSNTTNNKLTTANYSYITQQSSLGNKQLANSNSKATYETIVLRKNVPNKHKHSQPYTPHKRSQNSNTIKATQLALTTKI
eukprot:gene2735-1720_t